MCADSSHHLELRATGVRYLTDNPEQFIEYNTETSYLQYLSSVSMQGTRADNIVTQAMADAMNLKIYILESDENFRDMTIVEPANTVENPQSIYIGHIGQVHYVSSCSALYAVKIQIKLTRTISVYLCYMIQWKMTIPNH